MSNKRLGLIGLGVALVLGLFSILLFNGKPAATADQLVNVSRLFRSAAVQDDSSLIVSNGRGFVSYNFLTGETTRLSSEDPASGLDSIETLSASKDGHYLLFHTEQTPNSGDLAGALQRKGMDPGRDYWWIYSVGNKTFQPLPAGSLLPKFEDDSVDVLAPGKDGEAITTYGLNDLAPKRTVNIPGSADFWKYKDGYLLQSTDNAISFTTDGVVSQTYYKDITIFGLLAASNRAYAIANTETATQLLELDLADHSQKRIADDIVGTPVMSADGSILYRTFDGGTSKYVTYEAAGGNTTEWTFGGTAKNLPLDKSLDIVSFLRSGVALLANPDGQVFLVGSELHEVKSPHGYSGDITIEGAKASISFAPANDTFVVLYPGDTTASVLTAVRDKLQKDGINPDLYHIDITSADSD